MTEGHLGIGTAWWKALGNRARNPDVVVAKGFYAMTTRASEPEANLPVAQQPDPMLREGPAPPLKIAAVLGGATLVVVLVLYGMTRPEHEQVATAPTVTPNATSSPAPAKDATNQDTTTKPPPRETTGQATPAQNPPAPAQQPQPAPSAPAPKR